MTIRPLILAMSLGGLLAGCDQMPNSTPGAATTAAAKPSDTSEVLATVNGTPITENMVVLYEEQMQSRRPGAALDRNAVLNEVVNLELASQAGMKQGLGDDSRIQLQIDQQRRAVLASAAIQHYLQNNPVSDDELQKLYDEQVPKGNEYKARHILLKEEDEAKKLIEELDKGADFSELAKEHSTGPSGANGGELGWFSPKQMVAPFSEAAAALEKGSYTKAPVKTQFGWHIIILDDVRETTPPALDQVKPQLQNYLQQQRVQSFVGGLREGAQIDMKQVAEAPAPAESESADTAQDAPAAAADSEPADQ